MLINENLKKVAFDTFPISKMEKARFEKRLFSHEITYSSVRRQSVDIEYLLITLVALLLH